MKTFFMFLFSTLCNAAYGIFGVSGICVIAKAIKYQCCLSEAVTLAVFFLFACVALVYISRIPLLGDTADELKKLTPIAPTMRRRHMIGLQLSVLVGIAGIIFSLWVSSVDPGIVQESMEYMASKELITDTEQLYIAPVVKFDDYISLAYSLKQIELSTSETDPLFTEAVAYRLEALSDIRNRYSALVLSALVFGLSFTFIRLRTNYVVALKCMKGTK